MRPGLARFGIALRRVWIGLGVLALLLGLSLRVAHRATPRSAAPARVDAPTEPPIPSPIHPQSCGLARFGASLAADGPMLLVGAAAREPSQGQPAACLYQQVPEGWVLRGSFRRGSTFEYDDFASSVALRGDWVVANAPGHENGDGDVHVFHHEDAGWVSAASVADPVAGGVEQSYWAEAVALGDHELYIANELADAVHVYGAPADKERQRLTAPEPGSDFGAALATDGRTLAIGAPGPGGGQRAGSVELFRKDGDTWVPDTTLRGSAPGDEFGAALALSAGVLVVGAPEVEMSGAGRASGQGYVEVFRHEGSAWRSVAVLRADPARDLGWFGRAVAIAGTRILVGEPGGPGRKGRAWRFVLADDGSIQPAGPWEPAEAADGDWFGASVAIGMGWEAVGAPRFTRSEPGYVVVEALNP